MFEDAKYRPLNIRPDDGDLRDFNPSLPQPGHGAKKLREKWAQLRSKLTVAYERWCASGNNDPSTHNFRRFVRVTGGVEDLSILYALEVFKNHPCIDIVLRTLPEGASFESCTCLTTQNDIATGKKNPLVECRSTHPRNECALTLSTWRAWLIACFRVLVPFLTWSESVRKPKRTRPLCIC